MQRFQLLSRRRRALPAIITLVCAAPVQAELEEVTVTAQRVEESALDVPVSVNTVSGEKLVANGLGELDEMQILVPNFTITETGIGSQISIRGIGSGINPGFEQSVGMYVDGIYHGRAQLTRTPMFDLERVEVLRGPQSTLFGKNAIAGAISMTTAKPKFETEASLTAFVEPDDNAYEFRGFATGALSDTVAGRFAFLTGDTDGYFFNETLNRQEPEDKERFIRGTLLWEVTPALSATALVEVGKFDSKGRFLEVVNPVTRAGVAGPTYGQVLGALSPGYQLETQQNFRRQSNGDSSNNEVGKAILTLDWESDGGFNVISTTGYLGYGFDEFCDCDFTGASILTGNLTETYDQWSTELRVVSPRGERLEYMGGVYLQTSQLRFKDATAFPADSVFGNLPAPLSLFAGSSAPRRVNQESDLYAFFLEATYSLTERLRVTGGARFSHEKKSASKTLGTNPAALAPLYAAALNAQTFNISDSFSDGQFIPRAVVEYDVVDTAMTYVSYSEGFKSGGFDVRSNQPPSAGGTFFFGPETAQSWELGLKFAALDGDFEGNVALYHTRYQDLQVSQFDGTVGFNVLNAAEATVQGVEFDGRWQATDALFFTGSVAYLDFRYDEFRDSECDFARTYPPGSGPGLCDVSGKRREFTPRFSGAFSGYHTWYLPAGYQLNSNLDLIFSDSYYASPTLDPNLTQSAYAMVNMRVGVADQAGRWEVAVVGRNLNNASVLTFGNELPLSTTLTGGASTAYYGFYQHDRSVGIQATFNYF